MLTRIGYTASLLAVAALGLNACGSGSNSVVPQPPEPPDVGNGDGALLKRASSETELRDALFAGFTTIDVAPGEITAVAPGFDSSTGFTGTYTQEAEVDEFDAVRYDGEHLYIAPSRSFSGCCFIFLADTAANFGLVAPPPPEDQSLRILATTPSTGQATPIAEIPLDDGEFVQGMYTRDDELTIVTTEHVYLPYGDAFVSPTNWTESTTRLAIYETSDAANPQLRSNVVINGGFVDSRRIDDVVYVVSRHAYHSPELHYHVTTEQQRAENEALLDSVPLDAMLPDISVDNVSTPLATATDCFVTNRTVPAGGVLPPIPSPVLTTITAVPLSNPDDHRSVCYSEDAYGVYVSPNAIYLTQLVHSADGAFRPYTRLHKFALMPDAIAYRGSAQVEGALWLGGQGDFRASEHNGDLRIVTSVVTGDETDVLDHQLYVLRESADSPLLDVVGTLPNAQRPDEIGKPNEALYGVRFFGDRAYAVTFEQIDPLYVLDLSDPTDPALLGELEVTGFSDFLHPVNDELLLGLGRADTGGLKLELFDISDVTTPMSRSVEVLGGAGTHSEALHNRHAFTYQADVDGVDRLTIPASINSVNNDFLWDATGIFFYEVRNKFDASIASLAPSGSLIVESPVDETDFPSAHRHRAFIHGNTVYFVYGDAVWSAPWGSVGGGSGPF